MKHTAQQTAADEQARTNAATSIADANARRAAAKKAAQVAANYTGPATLSAADSRAAVAAGIVGNAPCATPGAFDLPDGHPHAERVSRGWNCRTNTEAHYISAPWLLCGIFPRTPASHSHRAAIPAPKHTRPESGPASAALTTYRAQVARLRQQEQTALAARNTTFAAFRDAATPAEKEAARAAFKAALANRRDIRDALHAAHLAYPQTDY